MRVKGFEYAKNQLDPVIGSRVIGAVLDYLPPRKRHFPQLSRSIQILEDVQHRKPADWFAIDDDGFEWPDQEKENLILTKGGLGLSELSAQGKVRTRLAGWKERAL